MIGEPSGSFIKGTPCQKSSGGKSKFVNQPMGINLLYAVGKDVAAALGLINPNFTPVTVSAVRPRPLQQTVAQHRSKCKGHSAGKTFQRPKNISKKATRVRKQWRRFFQL